LKVIPDTHFPATFTHMMGGYSAGYYGYLWSKVFAEDMFSIFEKKGLLSRDAGLKYPRSILESGNMREPMELIKEFLGRAPSNGAFFKSLGL
jgi:Zn-dependent oligopeptidase